MSIILTEFIPLLICKKFFDVWIFVYVIIQCYQRPRIIELFHSVAAIDHIRILTACDQWSDCLLCCLSGQPCLLAFCTCDLCDLLLDLIVIIDLCTRYCKKCGKLFHAG